MVRLTTSVTYHSFRQWNGGELIWDTTADVSESFNLGKKKKKNWNRNINQNWSKESEASYDSETSQELKICLECAAAAAVVLGIWQLCGLTDNFHWGWRADGGVLGL